VHVELQVTSLRQDSLDLVEMLAELLRASMSSGFVALTVRQRLAGKQSGPTSVLSTGGPHEVTTSFTSRNFTGDQSMLGGANRTR
jgi:hypothetical protein